MANSTVDPLRGNCVAPFMDQSLFPQTGGFIAGRFCAEIDGLPGNPTCCLPCPITDWTYPDSFDTYSEAAQWLNCVSIVLASFILLSFIVLPTTKTRSHYLSTCLVVSCIMIAIGFTLPLSTHPEQCFNAITPNDMYSLTECAWSGSFIIAGGLAADTWILIRALSMNLQIVWDVTPGKKFFYISQLAGWGVPATLFTVVMAVTGVSFRFGTSCHVNHHGSMGDFWVPLLIMAGISGVLQLTTFGYCLNVYLRNLWVDSAQVTATSDSNHSFSNSARAQTARAVWQRLSKVLFLQWRGISIVTIILVEIIFFAIVFVHLDQLQASASRDWHQVAPWLFCLATYPDDKEKCLHYLEGWIVNQSTVMAVLYLLSAAGIQAFLLLTRPAIFPAWIDFFRDKFRRHENFVSLDAANGGHPRSPGAGSLMFRYGRNSTTFEMQVKQAQGVEVNVMEKGLASPALSSPDEAYKSPMRDREAADFNSYQHGEVAMVKNTDMPSAHYANTPPTPGSVKIRIRPTDSQQSEDYFSQARDRPQNNNFVLGSPPKGINSRQTSISSTKFDPRLPNSRGGLGLNPPSGLVEQKEFAQSHGSDKR